uniref:Uncharacterized protein n=1 Tax=Ananas comosus var. bracteatus TaxID=296719 RepID=A0A6V7P4K3_ANACO|nr:unnamed protein product [Ananas comosus var. bracteatus]
MAAQFIDIAVDWIWDTQFNDMAVDWTWDAQFNDVAVNWIWIYFVFKKQSKLLRITDPKIFWRVIDSVPTYGSYPEICGLKLCTKTQKVGLLVCSRVAFSRLCTGTWLMAVPVRGNGYRYAGPYTGTQAASQPTRGSGLAFSWGVYRTPRPLVFLELGTSGEEGKGAMYSPSLIFFVFVGIFRGLILSFCSFLLLGAISTMGESLRLGVELVEGEIFNPS